MKLDHLTDLELAVMQHLLRMSPDPTDRQHVDEILLELRRREREKLQELDRGEPERQTR